MHVDTDFALPLEDETHDGIRPPFYSFRIAQQIAHGAIDQAFPQRSAYALDLRALFSAAIESAGVTLYQRD